MSKCRWGLLLSVVLVLCLFPNHASAKNNHDKMLESVSVGFVRSSEESGLLEFPIVYDIGENVVTEVEPNDSTSCPNHIYSDKTVVGELSQRDKDMFLFTLADTSEIEFVMASYDSSTMFGLMDKSNELIATSEFAGYQEGYAIQHLDGWLKKGHYRLCVLNTDDKEDIYMLYYLREDHVHVWEVVFDLTEPTCVESGYTTYICYCGDVYDEHIAPTGNHTYSVYISDNNGTPEVQGTKSAYCTVCNDKNTVADEGVYLPDVVMQTPTPHLTGNIIRWDVVEGASFYQVFRLENGTWQLLKNTGGTAYKDETAPASVKSYYKVRARNGNLMSSMAIPSISVTRPALSKVTISDITPHLTGNIIRWDAVANAQFYQVYRLNESSWELLVNTGGTAYRDETAPVGVKSYYKIVARNGNYASSIATTVSAAAVRPAPISSLDVVTITEIVGHRTGNIIRWNAIDNAVLYQVYRLNGSSWELLKNTGGTAYKDEMAPVGVRAYYKIVARNGNAASDIAKTKSASGVRP